MKTAADIVRDTRLDVLRAVALLTIFINHVPGNPLEPLTHKNFGFSDSAEAFVLISGIAVGLSYGTRFTPGARILQALKAWRRAGVLYLTHMTTTMAALAIFAAAAIFWRRPDLLGLINIDVIVKDTPRALLGLATLGHQVGYNNILPLYAAVMLLVPVMLLLTGLGLRVMLAASGALWLAAGLYQIAPPNYPNPGFWFLNPLSWQFLFAIGIAGALHVKRGGSIAYHPLLAGAALAYVIGALLWVRLPLWGTEAALGLPAVLGGFDKTFLSLPRLLHVLSLAYLVASIPSLGNLARTRPDHPLAMLGRHALPVFVLGTLLAMAAQVLREVTPHSVGFDLSLIAVGVALQFALAWWLDFLPRLGWGGKAKAVAPRQAEAAEQRKSVPMAAKA